MEEGIELITETKKCSSCFLEKEISQFSLETKRGKLIRRAECKNCRSKKRTATVKLRRMTDPYVQWAILASGGVTYRAKQKKLPIDLNTSKIKALLEQSQGLCSYCGCEIDFQCNLQARHTGPSLDRILPDLGYIENNIVLSCYRCNAIKNNAYPAELERIAAVIHQLVKVRGLG